MGFFPENQPSFAASSEQAGRCENRIGRPAEMGWQGRPFKARARQTFQENSGLTNRPRRCERRYGRRGPSRQPVPSNHPQRALNPFALGGPGRANMEQRGGVAEADGNSESRIPGFAEQVKGAVL